MTWRHVPVSSPKLTPGRWTCTVDEVRRLGPFVTRNTCGVRHVKEGAARRHAERLNRDRMVPLEGA